jgi:hypothetical protein
MYFSIFQSTISITFFILRICFSSIWGKRLIRYEIGFIDQLQTSCVFNRKMSPIEKKVFTLFSTIIFRALQSRVHYKWTR